jgi:hypothetical protein
MNDNYEIVEVIKSVRVLPFFMRKAKVFYIPIIKASDWRSRKGIEEHSLDAWFDGAMVKYCCHKTREDAEATINNHAMVVGLNK